MCGIVGIVRFDGQPVDAVALRRMGDALAHRGPDDADQWVDATVGLHHRRLSIIDIAGGRQPMSYDGCTLAFNGEIYNYVELREELRARGHAFRTASDTEVLLHAYAEYGPACVTRLNGMFAFLLYDAPRHRLVAARDHLGVKPLYWTADERRALFASEAKALLRAPGVTAAADEEALHDYMTFQLVLGERTLYRDIRKLLPGHVQIMDVDSGEWTTTRYWAPSFAIDRFHTREYFVTELRRLLEDSVRLQMRSDVAVGAYLSGGLDSSVVTVLAARAHGEALPTFTGAFREGPEFDETPYALAVAAHVRADPSVVLPTEQEFVDLLPWLVAQLDEPVAGPGAFPQYVVARHAAQRVKVVLGGQGGDEVFGGYARYLVAYLEQALKGAVYETNEEAEHIVSLQSIVPNLSSLREYVPMLQQFWGAGVFDPMDRRYFRLVDRSGGSLALLSPDFRAAHCEDAIFARFQTVFNHPETLSYFNKMTHFDLVTGLPALLHVEDRVSMAVSLETRVPLLDYRIVDLVTSMPPAMKFRGGELKHVFRRAVRDLLPAAVRERKDKRGFPVPLHLWARGRCHDFFADTLLSSACRTRGLFDPCAVETLLRTEPAFGRRLWGLLCLELWFRECIDG
ncbi:MAG TPA: asparagine synthase (glutamine-hydrolyzing) [Gemmatimonadaceae bacterium]|nr:asparagine synthase (glutamine-hydrolyzing) [Gemmatimonadaceae bacterium]